MKHFMIGHDNISKDDPNYCSLVDNLRIKLHDDYAMIIPEHLVPTMYRIFFRSFAIMTKYHASKQNHKTGFSFKDAKGQFLIGTILTYNAPESEDEDGNWNLSMTFYPEDMEGLDMSLDTFSDNFMSIVQAEMFSEAHAHCDSNADMIYIISEFVSAIKNFLDANSNNEADPDADVTLDGVFKASVGIEGGTKIYSIIPGSAIKQIIKNDDATEKADKAA